MADTDASLQTKKASFIALRDQMSFVLGIQTVDLLIDRAVAEIDGAHPSLNSLRFEAGVLDVASIDAAFDQTPPEEAGAAFEALAAVMMLILARLLGKRVAENVAESIDSVESFKGVRV